METELLNKIHEDLELLKKDVNQIKIAINLEPELRDKIKERVKEARARIAKGDFVSNEEVLKEFELEWNSKRIIKRVNVIADDPRHYLEFLVDIEGYKLRIGDYRALIDLDETKKLIEVILVGHRKDVYKYIGRLGFRKKIR